MADCDTFSSILPALRSNILGGVTGTNDKYVLALELSGITEVMCVSNSSRELLHTLEMRSVWDAEMSSGADYVVEHLCLGCAFFGVFDLHCELLSSLIKSYITDSMIILNVLFKSIFPHASE